MGKTAKITFKEFSKNFEGDHHLRIGCHLAFKQWAKSNHIEYSQHNDVTVKEPYYEFDDPMDLVKLKLELNHDFIKKYWKNYVSDTDGLEILKEFQKEGVSQ